MEVLEWYEKSEVNTSRVGIRLPTGAGKSLIALLILESWRREGKPVALLAASKGLAQDLETKAAQVKIPTVTIFGAEGNASYQQQRTRNLTWYKLSRAIGIFNYHSFLYSTEYKQETIPPQVMVIDDANEFELVRNDFFTVRVDRDQFESVYLNILERLRAHFTIYPNLESFIDRSGKQGAVELIHFNHAHIVLSAIAENWHALSTDTSFRLSYERNRDRLPSFVVAITEDEVELRSLAVPEDVLKLKQTPQIIFMGATLHDKELLQRSFGIRNTSVDLITEENLSQAARDEMDSFGKRLILPVDTSKLVETSGAPPLETILSLVKSHKKLLVLANSKQGARAIQNFLNRNQVPTLFYQYNEDAEKFKTMSDGALICANRYIGLDFPAETVQACCIVQLPVFLEPLDSFYNQVLFNTNLAHYKIANRLIQAFGRCNRRETDEAVYYILDPRILARFTGEEQFLAFMPRRIYAELYTGFYLSQEGNPASALEYGSKFLGRKDPNYDKFMKEEKELWKPTTKRLNETGFEIEIEAWEKSLQGSYETAATNFEALAETIETSDPLRSAWLRYLSAMNYFNAFKAYHQQEAEEKTRRSLKESIESGGKSSWFNRLREIFNELTKDESSELKVDLASIEARRIKEEIVSDYDDFINSNTVGKKTWQGAFNDLRSQLRAGKHGQMLVVLETMLPMMGYKTRRGDPKKSEPDLIAMSAHTVDKYQLSIEAKTKHEGEIERKESVGQALSDAKVIGRKSKDYRTVPLLITQKEEFSPEALKAASKEVLLFKTQEFDHLLNLLYHRIEAWSRLASDRQRQAFIELVISPHELVELFTPGDDPVLTNARIDSTIKKLG